MDGFLYMQVSFFEIKKCDRDKIDNIIRTYMPIHNKIYVYDYESKKYVGKFDSVKSASDATTSRASDISNMLHNKNRKSVNGYIFSFQEITDFAIYKRKTKKYKKNIYVYKENEIFAECNSVPEASSKTMVSQSKINNRLFRASLCEADGYVFTNHLLCDKEIHSITKDRYDSKRCKIEQRSIDGTLIRVFNSIADASFYITGKRHSSAICDALQSINKTAYGYKWIKV